MTLLSKLFFCVACEIAVVGLSNCGGTGSTTVEFNYDFSKGSQGWIAGSSDYPVAFESQMNITTEIAGLPSPLDQNRTAFHLGGNNDSDDLFLYLKTRITGLKPNTQYSLTFHVDIATNTSSFNVMFLKAGGTIVEPDRVIVQPGAYYIMNIDKDSQGMNGGKDAVLIGTNVPNNESGVWQIKSINSPTPFVARADQDGALWLLVGGDCTFEVWNEIYYTDIRVAATPIS